MGYGSYTAADWSKLRASRKMDSSKSENEIFTRQAIDPRFDPRFVNKREARDSKDHPNSTPIILGLDVTGSMGYLANQIAQESLNETMMKLYSTNIIEDPALLFAAYGDYMDAAPLQVTQFESDIRIAEQLLDLWLELHGSGQVVPSTLWHFAANHTSLDSYEKHDKKGFLITIGDGAECRSQDLKYTFEKVFDEKMPGNVEKILKQAQEKFEVVHIFVDTVVRADYFKSLLPGRTMNIAPAEIAALPEIIIATMQIINGTSKAEVLAQVSDVNRPIVEKAISTLAAGSTSKGLSF